MKKLLYILLFISFPLYGADYYVSSSGDDVSNDGSIGTPWKTLSYGVTQCTSGDNIFLLSNITDNAYCDVPVGVDISSYGGNIYTITTSYVAASAYYGYLRLYSASLTNGNQTISRIILTTTSGTRGISIWHRYNVDVFDCQVRNFIASGILFEHEPDWLNWPANFATGNSVYNTTIVDCGDRHYSNEGGLRITGQQGFHFYNSSITNNGRAECYNGNTVNISHCITVRIYDNTFTKPDHNGSCGYAYDWNFFAEIFQSRGVEWKRNTHIGAATIDLGCPPYSPYASTRDTCAYVLSIHHNTFNTSTGQQLVDRTVARNQVAINLEASLEYCYIYNNVINNYPTGIEVVTSNLDYMTYYQNHVYIYNNILNNIGWSVYPYSYGIEFLSEGSYGGTESRDNIHIWNNTIYGGPGNNYNGIDFTQVGNCTNSSIKNNIVRGFSNSGINLKKQASYSSTFTDFYVTYNDLYENGNTNDVLVQTGVTRTGGSITTGNLKVDPVWVTLADFRLQETSTIIGQGISVGLTLDFLGHAWANPPSMGAYEFGTPIVPPIIEDYPDGLLKYNGRFLKYNGRLLKIQ
jgi:hypothetical protein